MDNEHCQNHPNKRVTARCVRFNRRFCDLDFREGDVECLSEGTYCEYRSQCMVWEKVRERKRQRRGAAAEDLAESPGG